MQLTDSGACCNGSRSRRFAPVLREEEDAIQKKKRLADEIAARSLSLVFFSR